MNRKIVFYMLGKLLHTVGTLMVFPLIVSLIYHEACWLGFVIAILVSLSLGTLFMLFLGQKGNMLFAKEGFAIVAFAWILMSLIGALPFYISGEIPSYIDAFFETVSGFTTTGSSILTNVEDMSKGLLFWRSFTNWLGGMGVLVFVMALIPQESGRTMHVMRAEMPGPIVGKLVPRIRDTAKILYLIYLVMSAVMVVLLLLGGMPLFDSIVHTFSSAGTGGFGIKADSIGSYSTYCQWVIAISMMLFGVNFNLYYLILIKRFRSAIKSTELWWYLGIMFVSALLIGLNIYPMYKDISDTAIAAFFQVSSIMTTAGFSTVDFNLWPSFSKMILVILMFIGASAGSTGGGIKVSRIIIGIKSIRKNIKKMIHPKSVSTVKFEGKPLNDATVSGIGVYFIIYFVLFFVILLLISLNGFDFETNFTAVATTFNNIGPGLASVGPMASFAQFSPFSKIVLSLTMLLGRLEIFPILLVFTPFLWKRK